MTKVSFISGLPGSKQERYGSRKVAKPQAIDYARMSEGEMRLQLYRDRMEILEQYYPDNPEYKAYRQAFDEGLKIGHTEGTTLNGIGYTPARGIIEQTRRLDRPAVNMAGRGWFGLGSVENDCLEEQQAFNDAQGRFMRAAFWNKKKRREEMESALLNLNDCTGLLEVQRVLNEHLEDSSHHILYYFAQNVNSYPAVVAAKSVNHRLAVANMAKVSGLSETNLREWITNGVMRSNAKKGTDPFDPQQTINIMATEVPEGASVSGAFLAALPAIIKAITAAAAATGLLISQLKANKQQQLMNNLQGYGYPPFGPESNDWQTGQQGSGNYSSAGQTDYLPLLLGGAALLILK